MKSTLESAVIPSLELRVGTSVFTVEFPLSAVIEAETQVGHSLKSINDWFNMPAAEIPAILRAGLLKNHPGIDPEQVQAICDRLNPEALDEVLYALCHLAFPRVMARLEEKKRQRQAAASPNAPSGDGN